MNISIIDKKITLEDLRMIAKEGFGDMVKAVVDIERALMAIGGEMHADEEALLIEKGSNQNNLWGINLYPDMQESDWIEFDSMINVRPAQGNRSRGVENLDTQERIQKTVSYLIER